MTTLLHPDIAAVLDGLDASDRPVESARVLAARGLQVGRLL